MNLDIENAESIPTAQTELYNSAEGYRLGKQLLAETKLRDSYVIYSDAVAFGMIKAFNEKGVRVPEDVGIIGCENIFPEKLYDGGLTSVDRKFEERGEKAAEILFEAIDKNGEMGAKSWIAEPELIVRQSSLKPIVNLRKRGQV
jgi:LacI family transcriptional regulator